MKNNNFVFKTKTQEGLHFYDREVTIKYNPTYKFITIGDDLTQGVKRFEFEDIMPLIAILSEIYSKNK